MNRENHRTNGAHYNSTEPSGVALTGCSFTQAIGMSPGMYMSNGITMLRNSGWIRLHWNGAGGCGERIFAGCAG